MSKIVSKMHEGDLPGLEADLQPKPDWEPRYPGSGRLEGKVAIVTGGDSGIGRAVAVLFAREGADIVISHLEEEEDAMATAEMVEDEGAKAVTIVGDIGDPDHCREIVDLAVRKFGKIDILVNNAGEQHPDKEVTQISKKQLKRTFQTNVFGMFYMVQSAMPHLKEGAAIINCTSVTMYKGADELLDYSATKGAITAFTRSLSQNLAKKGIRVNGVAPGPIWTPLNPFGGASEEKLESFGEDTPMARPGQPNEVAPSFLFLACEDSSYMSGQVLHPNGGTIVGS
ncbi:SDR family oxidoreductase [Erythrobacter sp. WG]|uniref:SDR family oxidoreductase n=1 Tax=Erythrobacter sp. WG TaxID=2985510 RepID=UPI00226DCDC0|nr:SDR family oxidoreductase [Erythrobacter sp. WG]MCX9147054.1 SDR family oxidoreductase [Erythrobacter sp. WG]